MKAYKPKSFIKTEYCCPQCKSELFQVGSSIDKYLFECQNLVCKNFGKQYILTLDKPKVNPYRDKPIKQVFKRFDLTEVSYSEEELKKQCKI